MAGNDDFFTLAQLEQPQMMGNAPIGGGALAGMMYGQDKARQDQALQGALGLAQLDAMLKQQHASEDMAGAPGRMATTQYKNALALGNLGNVGSDLSTQADTSKANAKAAELKKLSPYAMIYSPDMTNNEKRGMLDDMRKQGITSIGNRDLSEVEDNLDKLDSVMGASKQALINSPEYAQKIGLEQEKANSWIGRMEKSNEGKVDVANIAAKSRLEVAQERDAAKKTVANIAAGVQAGKMSWSQAKAHYLDLANNGDSQAGHVLDYMQTVDLAKAAATAANQPPTYLPPAGSPLRPPQVPKIPSAPIGPGQPGPAAGGAPQLTGIDPAAMDATASPKEDPNSGTVTLPGIGAVKAQKGNTPETKGLYLIEEGELKGKIVDKTGKVVR